MQLHRDLLFNTQLVQTKLFNHTGLVNTLQQSGPDVTMYFQRAVHNYFGYIVEPVPPYRKFLVFQMPDRY